VDARSDHPYVEGLHRARGRYHRGAAFLRHWMCTDREVLR
jgi:hypothetical protein